jgi:hypothetical protein
MLDEHGGFSFAIDIGGPMGLGGIVYVTEFVDEAYAADYWITVEDLLDNRADGLHRFERAY